MKGKSPDISALQKLTHRPHDYLLIARFVTAWLIWLCLEEGKLWSVTCMHAVTVTVTVTVTCNSVFTCVMMRTSSHMQECVKTTVEWKWSGWLLPNRSELRGACVLSLSRVVYLCSHVWSRNKIGLVGCYKKGAVGCTAECCWVQGRVLLGARASAVGCTAKCTAKCTVKCCWVHGQVQPTSSF